MKLYPFLTALFLSCICLTANEIDITQPLRIEQLMPREGLFAVLAVEPALPKDFVALSKNLEVDHMDQEVDYMDWVYWGSEKVLKAYFKDENNLTEPILRVKLIPAMEHCKNGRFDQQALINSMTQVSRGRVPSIEFGKWGFYPYCMMSNLVDDKLHLAYVDLNDRDSGGLFFELLMPNKPEAKATALQLWNDFFHQTQQLPEPLFLKAQGQEIHPGYTIVNVAGRKIKVIAEKRKSDKKIQWMAIPQNQATELKTKKVFKTLMGCKWHHGEPILKIEGTYIIEKGWVNLDMTTSVLIKEVDEFTSVPLQKNVVLNQL